MSSIKAVAVVLLLLLALAGVHAADEDVLQDYCVADNANAKGIFTNGVPCLDSDAATATDFKTSSLATPGKPSSTFGSVITRTTSKNLAGSNTQGLTMSRIDFAVGGVMPLHYHPRASELVFLMQGGPLLVGFLDTNNNSKLFQEKLYVGDIFVFPRRLTHFLLNIGNTTASSLSTFNSQNPGTSILPLVLFNSSALIVDEVLAKSFKLNPQEISNIRKQLGRGG